MRKEAALSYSGVSLVILTPALCSFVYGIDLGVTSFVLEMLRDPSILDDQVWWRGMAGNNIQQGLFVSGLSLGALIGSHLVFMYLARTIGRRAEMRIAACLYLAGTILNVSSGTILQKSPPWLGFMTLLLGRLLFGCGVGFIQHAAPIYMSEMCPARIRGSVVTAKEAFIVIGIVVGYAAGDLLSKGDPLRWADLYASTAIITIPVLLMSTMIPRSMRWLLMNGEIEEAKASMQFVHADNIDADFEELCQQMDDSHTKRSASSSSLSPVALQKKQSKHNRKEQRTVLFDKSTRKAFTASIGLVVLQQFSGQPSIISYVTVLFSAAGLSGNSSVCTALLMAVCASFTVSMVDRLGRKTLLKAGILVMCVATFLLSASFWGYHTSATDESSYFGPVLRMVILVSMFAYISGYQLSYGPITWLIVSEVFPIEKRGEATAFLVELNYCLNFVVQFLVPTVQACIGWGPTFGIFGTILAFSVHFIDAYVPETTGMTLEEIEQSLQQPSCHPQKRCESESSDSLQGIVFSESSNLLAQTYNSMDNFGSFIAGSSGGGDRQQHGGDDEHLIEATLEV
eukprot:CAMPEP_0119020736 /NCGR_PEP_ID=MMETSP1176-20130426/24631_1 /TAXON_ID=265551 /ORGANISM="Synedropsis recta cf, Strain CCMP1620" /LENGTH=569 /DNA_ID=CAMNT_0006975207 /DNA_START=39 /DNA_END=1748 /DNA_ORIENTATION=+